MLFFHDLQHNITYKTSRSGGKGGQNVNKVSSKVELNFNIRQSTFFNEEEKARIVTKLAGRLNSEGEIQITSQESRSQLANKQLCNQKLLEMLTAALYVQKKRKPTKPGKAAIINRLDGKRKQSLKKISRSKDWT